MQSGTTRINTLRIHSPARQAQDRDPKGLYIRRRVPEFGSCAYGPPIVDTRRAVAGAQQQCHGLRQTNEARDEAGTIQHKHVQHKHGSRQSGLPPSAHRAHRSRSAETPPGDDVQGRLS